LDQQPDNALTPSPAGRRSPGKRRPAEALAPLSGGWNAADGHAAMLLAWRRRRGRWFVVRMTLFVGLPTLATAAYFALLATPRYVTQVQLTYQTYQPARSLAEGLVQSVSGTSQGNLVDLGAVVYEYVRSPALLTVLDAQLGLRRAFSRPEIDLLSRLPDWASDEWFLRYYRSHVRISEGLGGYLTLDVEAFDPAFTLALARAVVAAADQMVVQIADRARADEVAVAEAEAGRQEARVRAARAALAAFQDAHAEIDPGRAAGQLGGIIGNLESDLAAARAQLAQSAGFLNGSSPVVIQLKARIASLEEQIRREQARLAGSATAAGAPYSRVLLEYSRLQLDEEFARTAYTAAEAGLSVARADALRKQNYLIEFAPPVLPHHPSLLGPAEYVATVCLGTLAAYGVISLLIGALRDQSLN
jgi:capsular polysaccharide transport system permease protein